MPKKDNISEEAIEIEHLFGNPIGLSSIVGLLSIAILLIFMVVIAHIVKYPDKIGLNVYLSTENPPIEIYVQHEAVIAELYVQDKQIVTSNQVIMSFQNIVNYKDVLRLGQWIIEIGKIAEKPIVIPSWVEDNDWSALSKDVYSLINSIHALNNLRQFDNMKEKTMAMYKEKETRIQLFALTKKQYELIKEELKLDSNNFNRIEMLQKQGVSSKSEVDKATSSLIQFQKQLASMLAIMKENELRIAQIDMNLLDLSQQQNQDSATLKLTVLQQIAQMNGVIDSWKLKNIIFSPISGTVSFSNNWKENQSVKLGENICTIVPDSETGLIKAYGKIKIGHLSQLNVGQSVQIELLDFPKKDYGMLMGTLESISIVPNDSTYRVSISVSNSLNTSFGKNIPFKPNLSGRANIIAKDKSILQRLFENIIPIIYQSI